MELKRTEIILYFEKDIRQTDIKTAHKLHNTLGKSMSERGLGEICKIKFTTCYRRRESHDRQCVDGRWLIEEANNIIYACLTIHSVFVV